MIYIITHETSEWGNPNTTDILFTSTDENTAAFFSFLISFTAKKIFDQYREFSHNDDYSYEEYFLYEYPEMDTINYPRQNIGTIIDKIEYDNE